MSGTGWSVRWVETRSGFSAREVFTDPQGVEWVRARSVETTELEIPSKTRGLPPTRLKRRNRPSGAPASTPKGCDVCGQHCGEPHELAF